MIPSSLKTIIPLLILISAPVHAQEKPTTDDKKSATEEKKAPVAEEKSVEPIQKKRSVKINGKNVDYVSTVGKMVLK
ncbi:MAG: hypothetical protein ACK57I_03450, partial [Akkermansiaceae bacterium]